MKPDGYGPCQAVFSEPLRIPSDFTFTEIEKKFIVSF
jgi:hypothetical protein